MKGENIAYKYRLYPNKKQQALMAKTFGCCRKIYNLMLGDKIDYYKKMKTMLYVTPAQYKDAYPFLKEVDSMALCNEQLNLERAFKNFFSSPKVGFPKFKVKHKDLDSYTTNQINNNIEIIDGWIKLPKMGFVKAKTHRMAPTDYRLKSVTVSKKRDGSFYASVLYEYDAVPMPAVKNATKEFTHIGLDYKSDGLYVDSLGNCPEMPHYFREAEKKLAKEQRRLAKMKKGSQNYGKQKHKIAKISAHVANQRADFLHKLSAAITKQYDLISVENLNMSNMAQSLHLGKSTLDNGYGMFISMLRYKQVRKGHYFVEIDKWYPSSQLCQCGYKNPITKDLSVRMITCPSCGRTYDRDINAAINIDKEGLRLYMQNAA